MDARIRLLGERDRALLETADDEVFDHPVQASLVAEFLADPRHHIVVATVDDRIVGMASALHYVHPDKPSEFFVNEVGVAEPHRRRGIARAMLRELLAHARSLGCREAWLATERDNAPARALYAGLGGREEESVTYTFALDPASRPGGN